MMFFKRACCLILLLFAAVISRAQHSPWSPEKKKVTMDDIFLRNNIGFSPLRLIDLTNPGIELSYGRFLASRYFVQASAAYLRDVFDVSPFHEYRGGKFGVEGRMLIDPDPYRNAHLYVGAEFAFMSTTFRRSRFYSMDPSLLPQMVYYADTIRNNKQTYTLNLKVGCLTIPIDPEVMIDMYTGFGIRYKHVHRTELINADAIDVTPERKTNLFALGNREGGHWTANLLANIRLVIQF